ncbi:MAG: hypothetical protein ACMG6E_02880, partial [Candidatus Roizmanbacteria bacterium]
MAPILLLMDTYLIVTTIVFLVTSRRIYRPVYVPPLSNVTVDAFIPTYNEPLEIVEMTALGAKS